MAALAAVIVLLFEFGVIVLVRHASDGDTNRGDIPGWAYATAASTIAALVLVAALLRVRERAQTLAREGATRARLEELTSAVINGERLDDMLDMLVSRLLELLACERVDVLLPSERPDHLVLRASAPRRQPRPRAGRRERTPPPPEVFAGSGIAAMAIEKGEPVQSEPSADGVTVAWPMVVDGQVVGLVVAASAPGRPPDASEVAFVAQATAGVARPVERVRLYESERRSRLSAEHARSHVAIVAAVSELFDSALEEYEPPLSRLADILVPSFADWCMVAEAGPDGTTVISANSHLDADLAARFDAVAAVHPRWEEPLEDAKTTGRSELRYGLMDADPAESDFVALAQVLGVESTIVLPVQVRGLSIGAIVLGRTPDRRGFRPSDQAAGDEVARRVAVAVERVLLYRDNRDGADAARRHADRIRRLMMAAPEITAPLSTTAVLETLAEQARRVLDAKRAVVTVPHEGLRIASPPVDGDDGLGTDAIVAHVESLMTRSGVGDVDSPPVLPADAESWLAVDITGTGLDVSVAIVLVGRDDPPFAEEDEAIVASMAQMAAAALANARLYGQVEANEERLRALLQSEPFAVIDLDLDGAVKSWNSAAVEMFGWPEGSAAIAGEAALPVAFPPSVERRLHELCGLAAGGRPTVDAELSTERPDGSRLELSVATAPVRDSSGTVTGVLAVVADVTERKDLELQLMSAQRLEAIGRLAGGIAHDFNNLLTVILGYSDLLLRRTSDDDPAHHDLEAIFSAGEQAAKVTSQLLTIGRHQVAEPAVVSMRDIVGGLEEVLRRLIAEDIVVDIAVESGWLLIDPGQMEQVLLNLVVNAGDAMPEGGRLTIRGRRELLVEPVSTGIDTVPAGAWVVLRVGDTGTGMAPDVLEHCFEPFFTTKEHGKGTGLGLATVYGIVDQHGGHIQIDTGSGGTEVAVYLPAVDQSGDRAPVPVEASGGRAAEPACVLLVEDEKALRRFATEVLVANGYTALVASDADAALELARVHAGSIDLLVTDVVMPGTDGVELAKRIHERRPGLPVLYMSGYTGDAKEKLAGLREASNFLAKPFRPHELVERVQDLLEGTAGTDQGSKR
jgi:PAS domain S-box-containing protein